ncbi:MAG: hypothetical protein QM582_11405 [Micropruina sp.]|uniref:hypothetical protein n=1 Tax=Micropruina sp. TaxID=2737536 RepID=UPI0039E5C9C5
MDQVWRYLSGMFELIGRAYRLDSAALGWVRDHPFAIWLAVGVALLAAISLMTGHAVVLLLNRITGWRFAAGLLLSATWLVALHAVESLVLWGLGSLFSGREVPYPTVLAGVLVATAPQVWGFLTLTPYLGPAISRLLSAWSAIVLWAVTTGTFDIGRWPALAVVGASWLLMHLLSTLCAPWLSRAMAALFERRTGRPFRVSGTDVLNGRPMITSELSP